MPLLATLLKTKVNQSLGQMCKTKQKKISYYPILFFFNTSVWEHASCFWTQKIMSINRAFLIAQRAVLLTAVSGRFLQHDNDPERQPRSQKHLRSSLYQPLSVTEGNKLDVSQVGLNSDVQTVALNVLWSQEKKWLHVTVQGLMGLVGVPSREGYASHSVIWKW